MEREDGVAFLTHDPARQRFARGGHAEGLFLPLAPAQKIERDVVHATVHEQEAGQDARTQLPDDRIAQDAVGGAIHVGKQTFHKQGVGFGRKVDMLRAAFLQSVLHKCRYPGFGIQQFLVGELVVIHDMPEHGATENGQADLLAGQK